MNDRVINSRLKPLHKDIDRTQQLTGLVIGLENRGVLSARSRDDMEAEDAPEERAALPAPQPAPPAVSGSARLDVNAPLRTPRALKGRYITKEDRLLRVRRLDSEMHDL